MSFPYFLTDAFDDWHGPLSWNINDVIIHLDALQRGYAQQMSEKTSLLLNDISFKTLDKKVHFLSNSRMGVRSLSQLRHFLTGWEMAAFYLLKLFKNYSDLNKTTHFLVCSFLVDRDKEKKLKVRKTIEDFVQVL